MILHSKNREQTDADTHTHRSEYRVAPQLKNFGQKNILVKKKIGPKCFKFLSKKLGRVNPGAGIYDPPPQKVVGLKLCGIVVSCLKRKFLFQ